MNTNKIYAPRYPWSSIESDFKPEICEHSEIVIGGHTHAYTYYICKKCKEIMYKL